MNEKNNTVTITTPQDDEDESWKNNTGTVDLDNVEVTGDGISVSDNIITISKNYYKSFKILLCSICNIIIKY